MFPRSRRLVVVPGGNRGTRLAEPSRTQRRTRPARRPRRHPAAVVADDSNMAVTSTSDCPNMGDESTPSTNPSTAPSTAPSTDSGTSNSTSTSDV